MARAKVTVAELRRVEKERDEWRSWVHGILRDMGVDADTIKQLDSSGRLAEGAAKSARERVGSMVNMRSHAQNLEAKLQALTEKRDDALMAARADGRRRGEAKAARRLIRLLVDKLAEAAHPVDG